MKLRINKQSIRFRLSIQEFETLKKYGAISEMISLGLHEDDCFFYRLTSADIDKIAIANEPMGLIVVLPLAMLNQWDNTNSNIGINEQIEVLAGTLNVLIEVDLPCKHG